MTVLRNRIYYTVKPFIPRRLRMALRRQVALRLRDKVGGTWPIMPGSDQPPKGWPGWPEGKKFALVLTHDVESQVGLNNCRSLMRLERDLGFRSSFNFIPEGDYNVPQDLRQELVGHGFEVGLHDLKHDGRLFTSRRKFSQRAARINSYLRDWGAVGFRSGFMLHKLDWLHELNIQYDASTFDTDPFEPQPEGQHTIFPFWVSKLTLSESKNETEELTASETSNSGYVELPYTLPQDSTLFLLLREQTPAIWFRKLDWIAAHGGMVLVNVHPDYITFDRSATGPVKYPVNHYKLFLQYATRHYEGAFWNTTPREVANYYFSAMRFSAAS